MQPKLATFMILLPQPPKVDYKHVPQVATLLPQMLYCVDFTCTTPNASCIVH